MHQTLKKILDENGFLSGSLVARKLGCTTVYARKIIEDYRREEELMEETERMLQEMFG